MWLELPAQRSLCPESHLLKIGVRLAMTGNGLAMIFGGLHCGKSPRAQNYGEPE
jgi:hypothetical protein